MLLPVCFGRYTYNGPILETRSEYQRISIRIRGSLIPVRKIYPVLEKSYEVLRGKKSVGR